MQVCSGRCMGMRCITTSLLASARSMNWRPMVDNCTSTPGTSAWKPDSRGISHFMASEGEVHTRSVRRPPGDLTAPVAAAMRSRLACTSVKYSRAWGSSTTPRASRVNSGWPR